ncbi:MAG TPA: undecaprenyl-diphosphate phosphatase [Patescibacteria group bacterium]
MNIIQAIILSVIEGLTEFLPISSTGHLILAEHFLNIPSTEFVKSFDIIIQLGAILAVVWLYWKKLLISRNLWKQIIIAFIPTGVLGLIFYSPIKHYLLDNIYVTIVSLFIGGIALLVIDRKFKEKNAITTSEKIGTKKLITIGLFQSISMIPGISRSAATIVGGLFTGLSRQEAVEFSFLLAIPTMTAATGLDLIKTGHSFSPNEIVILSIGFVVTFFSALIAVKAFTQYVANHNFKYFAIYRIILALVVLLTLAR